VKYKYLKAERQPGGLLEMDVKYVPGAIAGLRYHQYTVIDTATRWRHREVIDEQTTHHAIRMMEIVRETFPYSIELSGQTTIVRSRTIISERTNSLAYLSKLFTPQISGVPITTSYTTRLTPANQLRTVRLNVSIVKTGRSFISSKRFLQSPASKRKFFSGMTIITIWSIVP